MLKANADGSLTTIRDNTVSLKVKKVRGKGYRIEWKSKKRAENVYVTIYLQSRVSPDWGSLYPSCKTRGTVRTWKRAEFKGLKVTGVAITAVNPRYSYAEVPPGDGPCSSYGAEGPNFSDGDPAYLPP